MQQPGPISDVVPPPMKDLEWESHSVASTPLPDPNLGLLIPQEDTRPRPRSAGGSNRPTKSEEVVELVQFLETHDGPDTETELQVPPQGSRSYNIARGLFKAGHRRLRQLNKPRSDPWVKMETAEGRTYRSIAVPNRISLLGNQGTEKGKPQLPDIESSYDGAPVMDSGNANSNSNSVFSAPPFLGEITPQEEDIGNPSDRFYPGIGELPSVIDFSLPLPSTKAAGENNSHKITEPQNPLHDSTPAQQSEISDSEKSVARVRFDVGTVSAVANETVSRHDSATINGVRNNDDDRHELETQGSEVSISPSSKKVDANFSPRLRKTKNRADSADSTESSHLDQNASFHHRSSESSTSVSGPKSIIRGSSRCSPSPRSSSRQLNPGTSLQNIHEKPTWRGPTVILQRKSSRGLLQDRWSKSSSSPVQRQPLSTENTHTTSLLEKYLLPNGMTSSPLMPAATGSVAERAQSHYTFPDLENDDNKNSSASIANDVPYNGSPRSPPRPAPTKPLPSLPKNKASRSSSYNRDNDIESRNHAQPNVSYSNADTTTPRSSSRQGKLAKSPSRSIRRSRSALSRSHIKLHEVPTPDASTVDRITERENQQDSSAPSIHERKLSAERRERISRAERVYAVRMKDICAARARLENKMLEVREAGGDAMADEFTFSETRLLNNRDAGAAAAESEPNANDDQSKDRAGSNNDQSHMFSPRLPSATPSPPPKVPLPADPPHSLLSAFSIESILRGGSKPPHRSLEISPITTVYEQRPSLGNLPTYNSLYRSNSKSTAPDDSRRPHEQTSHHRDTHVSHSLWDKPPKTLPRSSTVLTNGKATPPRSTSPSLTSLDDGQAGRATSSHAMSGQEWNPPFNPNSGYTYGTPERQANGAIAFTPMTAIHRDDYIPPLSPRVRSNHSRTKMSESNPDSRHHQPTSHPQQQNTNNTIHTLESRVAFLERQNKMLQAALMSALDVGVTLDAENVRSGTPVRTATTTDGSDFGNVPNPRLKRHSGIIPRRPNSWLSVRSAQSRMSMGATSSGSEGAGVKAIEAMIGNLELGWSGGRQSVGDHGETNIAREQLV